LVREYYPGSDYWSSHACLARSEQGSSALESDGDPGLCVADGQRSFEVKPGNRVVLRRARRPALLQGTGRRDYFAVLRDRLHWGLPTDFVEPA